MVRLEGLVVLAEVVMDNHQARSEVLEQPIQAAVAEVHIAQRLVDIWVDRE
jgi:hypothetical protein